MVRTTTLSQGLSELDSILLRTLSSLPLLNYHHNFEKLCKLLALFLFALGVYFLETGGILSGTGDGTWADQMQNNYSTHNNIFLVLWSLVYNWDTKNKQAHRREHKTETQNVLWFLSPHSKLQCYIILLSLLSKKLTRQKKNWQSNKNHSRMLKKLWMKGSVKTN